MIMVLFDTVTVYVLLCLFGAFQALFSCCMYGCCAEVTSTGQASYMFMIQSLVDGCASLVAPIIAGNWTYCVHLSSNHTEIKLRYSEIEAWRLPPASHNISLVIQSQDTSRCTCFRATRRGHSKFPNKYTICINFAHNVMTEGFCYFVDLQYKNLVLPESWLIIDTHNLNRPSAWLLINLFSSPHLVNSWYSYWFWKKEYNLN